MITAETMRANINTMAMQLVDTLAVAISETFLAPPKVKTVLPVVNRQKVLISLMLNGRYRAVFNNKAYHGKRRRDVARIIRRYGYDPV